MSPDHSPVIGERSGQGNRPGLVTEADSLELSST